MKSLVIDTSHTTLPGVTNKWETIEVLESFTRDIVTSKVYENADKGAIVSGIPTVFARANLFKLALDNYRNSSTKDSKSMSLYYEELVGEWFGLITCIALEGLKVTIKRVDLVYSDGRGIGRTDNMYEPKGAFGNMLFNRSELWSEQNSNNADKVPFINIIKLGDKVIGGTSPECLLFTAQSYSIEDKRYAPKGKFVNPLTKGNLSQDELKALYAYVDKLVDKLENEFTSYFRTLDEYLRPNYTKIKLILKQWIEDIKSKVDDDVDNACAYPVKGFTSPFDMIFNYSDLWYGKNGVIHSKSLDDYTPFKAEELLLSTNCEIARIKLNSNAIEHYDELPVQLLEASIAGDEATEKAYFALPISAKGLQIFGANISVLLGKQDNNTIKSRLSAEYDPSKRTNNLTVNLTIIADDNKKKNVTVIYSVKSEHIIKNTDILLWPNFISRQWTKYYMYSELPHNETSLYFNAIPFVGERKDGVGSFVPMMNDDRTICLTDDVKELKNNDVNWKLLVKSGSDVADSQYKYEIYESNKPFCGVMLRSIANGNNKESGVLLIRYIPRNPDSHLPQNRLTDRIDLDDEVDLGFDFGSTNSSVAYRLRQEVKGFEFRNHRISLFLDDYAERKYQAKDFLFFPPLYKPVPSNSLKSILAVHDENRIPKEGSTYSDYPISGGIPCFLSSLPIKSVSSNTICLGFDNVDVKLINNMKWSERDIDRSNKEAFLKTVLLMVYAELFDRDDSLRPTRLNWSYPSAMGGNLISTHYNRIWQSLEEESLSPINDDKGNTIKLRVMQFRGSESNPDYNNYEDTNDYNSSSDESFDLDDLDKKENLQIAKPKKQEKELDLKPDDLQRKLNFDVIETDKPMTEACATANYFVKNEAHANKRIVLCFDIGGSTTDISALYKLGFDSQDNADCVDYMIKQNSFRFAAQNISKSIESLGVQDQFKQVLDKVCAKYPQKSLVELDKRYGKQTAKCFYEQMVDILDEKELRYFYDCISAICPKLFAANLYVTGLIMFYAGQISKALYPSVKANLYSGGIKPMGFQIVFAGKGARIFDWLSTKNITYAEEYYMRMFAAGYDAEYEQVKTNKVLDLSCLKKEGGNDVKYEVSKGLTQDDGKLKIPAGGEFFEIFGEKGFKGRATDGSEYDYKYTDKLKPDIMYGISTYVRQEYRHCDCFRSFSKIFKWEVKKVLGLNFNDELFENGIDEMDIEQYITQKDEGYKNAISRKRNNEKFDYVSPIIILEGLKFYEEYLPKCFK